MGGIDAITDSTQMIKVQPLWNRTYQTFVGPYMHKLFAICAFFSPPCTKLTITLRGQYIFPQPASFGDFNLIPKQRGLWNQQAMPLGIGHMSIDDAATTALTGAYKFFHVFSVAH